MSDLCAGEKATGGYPIVRVYRDGKLSRQFEGAKTEQELNKFIQQESAVLALGQMNFESSIAKGTWLVEFFAPWHA